MVLNVELRDSDFCDTCPEPLAAVCAGWNEHERIASELAAAQRALGLRAARASRATSWIEYGKWVASKANSVKREGGRDVACKVKNFRPSFVTKDNDKGPSLLSISPISDQWGG